MKSKKNYDAIKDAHEWLNHRYDPGYFTGGNINPIFRRQRPNKAGYILITFGVILLFCTLLFSYLKILPVIYLFIHFPVEALAISAGIKLLRPQNKK
jgi:hypothetical protein